MNARILVFPAPRTPVFRRTGPLRVMALIILLLMSAGLLAIILGSGAGVRPILDRASPQDPMTLGR